MLRSKTSPTPQDPFRLRPLWGVPTDLALRPVPRRSRARTLGLVGLGLALCSPAGANLGEEALPLGCGLDRAEAAGLRAAMEADLKCVAPWVGAEPQAPELSDVAEVALVLTPGLVTVQEADAATFSLVLAGPPSGPVVVSLMSDDAAVLSASPETLTFTPQNWHLAQSATVEAMDNEATGNGSVAVTLTASGAGYDGVGRLLDVFIEDDEAKPQPVATVATAVEEPVRALPAVPSVPFPATVGDTTIGGLSSGTAPGSHVAAPFVDWYALGISNASVQARFHGDGDLAYGQARTALPAAKQATSSLLYGVEVAFWTEARQPSLELDAVHDDQTPEGLALNGTSLAPLSHGLQERAEAPANLMGAVSATQEHASGLDGGLQPQGETFLALEPLAVVNRSGEVAAHDTLPPKAQVDADLAVASTSLGQIGRLSLRGDLGQVFGLDDVSLHGRALHGSDEDPVGAIGWVAAPQTLASTQFNLTVGD